MWLATNAFISHTHMFLNKRCINMHSYSYNNAVTNNKGSNDETSNGNNGSGTSSNNDNKLGQFSVTDNLSIYFYGPVTDTSCLQLTQAINTMDVKAKQQKVLNNQLKPNIPLHIQSGGGSLMPSFYVCDFIKNTDTPVYTYIDGFCASAASLISVCGKKRFMTKHSSMLIHQLSGVASGKFNEVKTEVKNLNFFMNNVRQIYLENTNLDEQTLDDLLKTDISFFKLLLTTSPIFIML